MLRQEILEEITLLNQFNIESINQGIKVHSHDASESMVAAAARLYEKGMTDHVDGGYLTDRGIEAAQLAKQLVNVLSE